MKMKKLLAWLLTAVMVIGLLPTMALATDDETFVITPGATISGESLGSVEVKGILDARYYPGYAQNPNDARELSITLPLYKVVVGNNYTEIKIDYDTKNKFAPQMFSSKQLSTVNDYGLMPYLDSTNILDWQNGKTITKESPCNTDELYSAEKEKLTAYAKNSNATYLLTIYAECSEFVLEGSDYEFDPKATAMALVLFEWENEVVSSPTFTIAPAIANFGQKLGDVSVTGILDSRYYPDYTSNPDDARSLSISLPLYKVTVGSDYTEIKIDYDTKNKFAPQMFSSKQLSTVNDYGLMPYLDSTNILDWQNGKTITKESPCNTDELYSAEKEKLTAYAKNSNATYLLTIYAECSEFVLEGSDYEFDPKATATALVLFEWENGSGGTTPPVDKTALAAAISSASALKAEDYHTSGDRYNGKDEDTIDAPDGSFWADMLTALAAAQDAYTNSNDTTTVATATSNLADAIAKLIPATQLNATPLYDAIRLNNIYYPPANQAQYTTSSWAAYRAVMDPAEAYLAEAVNAENTEENRNAMAAQIAEVKAQATNHVPDKKLSSLDTTANARLSDAQMAYAGLKYLRNNLFNPQNFTASKYENWSAFSTACDTASTFLTSHDGTTLTLENGVNEALSYKNAYQTFWTACYGLTGTAETITVTLDMTDTYARIKDTAPIAGGKRVLTLQKGASIEDALNEAGLSITALNNRLGNNTYQDPFHMIGLYVNGIYTQYGIIQESFPAAMTNRIVLNDGDHILIALMNAPFNTSSSGSGADPAGLKTVGDSIRYAYFQQNGKEITRYTATSGADIALTAAGYTALPTHYSGRVSGLAGAEIYRSKAYATEPEARAATASIATGTVTGADGSFSLKLYSAEGKTEGWYLLNVLSADKNQGLTNAPNLLVHVTDPEDLGAIRTDLTNKLNAIYTAYDEDFYTADQLSQVQAYYAAAAAVLSAGTGTSGDLNEAYETARAGITAIQAANEANLSKCLANVRELLKYLPNAADVQAGKLFDADKTVLDLLFGADGWYARMTPYQQGQFTSSEAKVITLLKEKYESSNLGANLPQLPAFTLTVEVRDADTNEIVDLPVFDSASVTIVSNLSYNERTGQFSGSGGNSEKLHFNANTTSYTLPSALPANGYYWLTISANVDWNQLAGYSYVGFAFSFDDSYILDENGTTYLLRENATKTCYVRSANTLSAAKQQALADLKTAYQSHTRSKYSAENWATLTEKYQDGVTAINNAANETAVQEALSDATGAMAAVEQDKQQTGGVPGWGEGSPFNVGAKVGTVTVTAENNTYKGGAFVGKLFKDKVNYAIGANDTMMTVILRALHDAGYTWEGTGGETIDGYDIDYLAKVKKDGKELGEFSGDPGSGWMGTLNDFMVNEGFQGFSVAAGSLSDGDTISLMYTQNLGEDLGGTWGNSDTTLKSLVVNDGALTLIPSFSPGEAGGSYDYALMIPGSFANLSFVPSASNKNYYVKMFLNEKVTDNTEGNSYYKRTETIPVHVGDIVYIGVGERDWPSMNKVGSEARFYTATWYAVHVLSANDGASVVNSMIAKLPAVTYSNYKDVAAQVKNIEQIKATLSATEQAKVNSLDAVKKDIKFYEDIDAVKALLAALPKSSKLDDAGVLAHRAEIEAASKAYGEKPGEGLSDKQKDYITVGDAANYNDLQKRLVALAPDTTAQTIVGGSGGEKKEKKDEGSEIAPAQVAVAPEVADGTAKAEVKAEDVSKALEEAPDAKTLTVKVNTEGAASVEADLPADAVRAAADAGVGLNVETEQGTVKLSAADVKAAGGKDLAVSVKSNADGTTSFEVAAGGTAVAANVKVELPAKDGQVLVIVNADGTEEVVKKCVTSDGKVYAEIPAGAKVKVADAQGMTFGDVKETDWFAGAVEFVTSRGIFQGTGDGFQPNAPMNRAMLVTVLQRIAGEKARGENTFGDVEPDAWYADAVIWASENGIVNGTDNGFEPDEPVTREQIATMLYRFMKYLGYDVSASKALDGFPDGGDASPWAKEAMEWAAGVGLFQGDQNGNLNPGGKATRAQVATLMQRLVTLIVK